MARFSDRHMTPPPEKDQYYGYFPARYVTEYLEAYIDNHTYNNQVLRDRIMFNVQVESVSNMRDGFWTISMLRGYRMIKTRKLIDATGLTSWPNIPHLPGRDDFQGKALHHKDFGRLGDLRRAEGKHVAVLGGGKSAADVAYAAAKASKTVSWIIRENGNGPAAFLSCEGKGQYANSNESFYTRLVASFLPNPFGQQSYLSRYLHGTRAGRWLVKRLWDGVNKDQEKKVNYDRTEGSEMGFKNLKPDTP